MRSIALNVCTFALFLTVGIYLGPVLRVAYEHAFPEPEYISGDYSEVLRAAGKPVVMYSTSLCPHCKDARTFLDREHIAYRDYVIDQSPDAEKQFKLLGGDHVPLLFIGSRRIVGFRESTIRDSLALIGR